MNMKTASRRYKFAPLSEEGKDEHQKVAYLFPCLLGIASFVISVSLSFYSFWSNTLELSSSIAIGATFASLAAAIFIVTASYFALRKKFR